MSSLHPDHLPIYNFQNTKKGLQLSFAIKSTSLPAILDHDSVSKEDLPFDDTSKQVVVFSFVAVFSKRNRTFSGVQKSAVDKIIYWQVGLNFSVAHRQDIFNILVFGILKMFGFSGRKAHLIFLF